MPLGLCKLGASPPIHGSKNGFAASSGACAAAVLVLLTNAKVLLMLIRLAELSFCTKPLSFLKTLKDSGRLLILGIFWMVGAEQF